MFRSASDIVRINRRESISINGDELYGCEFCSEGGWSSETEVEIHKSAKHKKELKSILNEADYVCGICIKEFDNGDELLKHIKTDHLYSSENAYRVEREIFVCDDCCQLFFNKLHLIVHIKQYHGSDNYKTEIIECPQCHDKFKRKQIWLHTHTHNIQSISSCRLCFIKLPNRRELKEHLNRHGHYFKCDMCGYNSKKSYLFNQHIKDNHKKKNNDVKKFKKVKKYFIPREDVLEGKGQILMIFRGVYLSNLVKICVMCREICVGYRQMSDHITHDHNTSIEMVKHEYRCGCGEVFNNKVLLKHHVFKMKGDHSIQKAGDE
ncbi:zinc finger protein 175-like [Vanessa tameamea]|uniref:Zinc finger protein 175-like n=1 Tax=Vanessa tameamea TaxID=334116 RepID=A0ABM4AXU5_VANTA|nr:zinc finger protein 175-like [Vanessa tameamea]